MKRLRRSRDGSTQLEFALMLPFFLLFLTFTLNMGVLIVEHGALQHATNAAARAGAQVGGAGIGRTSSRVFNDTVDAMPGLQRGSDPALTIVSGNRCSTSGSNREVVLRSSYRSPLAIPGMNQLLAMTGAQTTSASWTLRATSVARCEIVR